MIKDSKSNQEGETNSHDQNKGINVRFKDSIDDCVKQQKVMFEEVEKTEVMGKKRIEKDEKHDTKSKQQKQILKKPAKEENPKIESLLKQKDDKIKELEEIVQRLTSENWKLSHELDEISTSQSSPLNLQKQANQNIQYVVGQKQKNLSQSLDMTSNLGKHNFSKMKEEKSPNTLNTQDSNSFFEKQKEDDMWQAEDLVNSLLQANFFNQSIIQPQKMRLMPLLKPHVPNINIADPSMNIQMTQRSLNKDLFRAAIVKRNAFIKNTDESKQFGSPRTSTTEKNSGQFSLKRGSSKSLFEPAALLRPYQQNIQSKERMQMVAQLNNMDNQFDQKMRVSNSTKSIQTLHFSKNQNDIFFDKVDKGNIKPN